MEKKKKFYLSLKMRLLFLLFVIVIPLTFMVAGYQRMFENYSRSYNEIMANLKVANEYNIKFKSDMEYSMYRVMIGLIDVDKFENGDILEGKSKYATVVKNPLNMIASARHAFGKSMSGPRSSTRQTWRSSACRTRLPKRSCLCSARTSRCWIPPRPSAPTRPGTTASRS